MFPQSAHKIRQLSWRPPPTTSPKHTSPVLVGNYQETKLVCMTTMKDAPMKYNLYHQQR